MVLTLGKSYPTLDQERNGQALRVNVPSPSGGLNTKDSESAMEPTDAVIMENWFPSQGSVTTRKGFTQYATGLSGYVETLMEYNANTVRKLICANGSTLNDITNPASIVSVGTGFTNARFQWVNFNANLIMAKAINEADIISIPPKISFTSDCSAVKV
jgi:hypothetical protein